MIRGAIAFGLVLRIDKKFKNRDVIVTTSLALVVFTTVVFGSTVSLLQRCLFKEEQEGDDVEIHIDDEDILTNSEKSPERQAEME